MQVLVRDNNVDQALKVLKKMQREGVFREMKRRKQYEKPSERKVRERSEAIRLPGGQRRPTKKRARTQLGQVIGQVISNSANSFASFREYPDRRVAPSGTGSAREPEIPRRRRLQ